MWHGVGKKEDIKDIIYYRHYISSSCHHQAMTIPNVTYTYICTKTEIRNRQALKEKVTLDLITNGYTQRFGGQCHLCQEKSGNEKM